LASTVDSACYCAGSSREIDRCECDPVEQKAVRIIAGRICQAILAHDLASVVDSAWVRAGSAGETHVAEGAPNQREALESASHVRVLADNLTVIVDGEGKGPEGPRELGGRLTRSVF
jgi:hypothetical protein